SILEVKIKSGKWIPPESTMPYEFKVEGIEPRKKEGGMFVNFSFRADPKLKESALEEIENHIKDHLNENKLVPWFNFQPNKAYLVEGEPFIEDLVQRYPASRLRVEFKGTDVSIEPLFYTFRKYGLIRDINLHQESAKEPPRYALIAYSNMRSAASARNCVHGKIINSTRLNIFYDQPLKSNLIYNWMVAHPRISVPLIAAIIAGVSYIIFDPIRVFFIESKLTQRFNLQEYRIYQWLKRQAIERILYRNKSIYDPLADISIWKEREQEKQKLRNWLKEPPETFIVLLGPTGTGKSKFIEQVIQDKKNKIVIKCDEILNSHNEHELILRLAKQVGYFPVFSLLISMSNLIDGLASAMIGNKTIGFSSSADTEIKKILDTLAIALHDIAPVSLIRKHQKKSNNFIEPQFVESYDPADIPIVVIDSYMTKDTTERQEIWNHLAKLAALLVDNGVAHVVFVSSNVGIIKSLSKVFPNKTFNHCNLTDAPVERAVNMVKMNVDGYNIEGLEDFVGILGGRLTDLRFFINKIRGGQTPRDALNDLIKKANIEIRKIGFGDDTDDAKTIPWKGIQFWKVMKELARNDRVCNFLYSKTYLYDM
ncbi:6063_t:CDS:10, partial [Cetraspora pellucida]